MRVLLLDNRDCFTFNLVQTLRILGADVLVRPSRGLDPASARALAPSHLVISPGPGHPRAATHCTRVLEALLGQVPVLGVCLGHQVLARVLGGRTVHALRPLHGKPTRVFHDGRTIFEGLANPMQAGRYHSLIVAQEGLADGVEVSAHSAEGEVLGIRQVALRAEGVQFHPESILTPDGERLLARFLELSVQSAVPA